MGLQQNIMTLKTSTQLIVYGVLAGIAFIPSWGCYKLIKSLPNMSTSVSVTISLCFFLIVFFVLYMGTIWTYERRFPNQR